MDSRREEETEQRGWFARLHLSWPMLFLAGWLLYEFTAQPGLAALVFCTKFGWEEVRNAFWLRRVDPDRPRGQACFWAYLAFGLCKVASVATVAMIVLSFVSALVELMGGRPRANNGLQEAVSGLLTAILSGWVLSCPFAYVAFWSALRNGVRIWIGEAPYRARTQRFWPPHDNGANCVEWVRGMVLLTTGLLLAILAGVLLGLILPAVQRVAPSLIVFLLVTSAAVVLVPFILLRVSTRVIARSPQECWNAEEDEAIYEVSGTEEEMNDA